MFKKINNICFIIFLISCFLFSCKDKSGPYRVGLLTQLKSSNDTFCLVDYNRHHHIGRNGHFWSFQMIYNSDQKNIIACNFIEENSNITYDEKEEEITKEFLNNYYFITAEKLSMLFPVKSVSAFYKDFSKNSIYLVKYDSIEDKKNNTYHNFSYLFEDGFLFLRNYEFYNKGELQIPYPFAFNY